MKMEFSDVAQKVIETSGKLAQRFGDESTAPEHFLLAVIDESLKNKNGDNMVIRVLKHLRVNLFDLIEDIEDHLAKSKPIGFINKMQLSQNSKSFLQIASVEANDLRSDKIGALHILLAYFRFGQGPIYRKLYAKYNLAREQLKEAVIAVSQSEA